MTDLVRRAAARVRTWNTARLARAAHTAALYGDHRPGLRLVGRTVHRRDLLAVIAAVWCDAYLADTAALADAAALADTAIVEAVPVVPADRRVEALIAARTGRDAGEAFSALIREAPEREIEFRLAGLLETAAFARLELDGPDPDWP
ncbi:hypothetical protein HUT06_42060 [Actinomadura sp. NAK00032]|uniref:hypothetical protein n=1 Tax=Actinomadura sp. NAK00032 TaxID=2742128 RepID=UPI001590930E|nr:hypothetical protein [Actinomadura sp. NAK00032]QKW39809.1 hypothetical protein HUT06_42060 [Actinomadura sp. NAK00032]